MPVSVVILAAGQGKRMHSALPKVLQPLAGRPLLEHVLAAARALEPAAIHVVYGHGGEQVRAAFEGQSDLKWVQQAQQLGTGHAVLQAMPAIPDDHHLVVLLGDVPLRAARDAAALVEDSARWRPRAADRGRRRPDRLRPRACATSAATCERIVEDKDASDDERASTRSTPASWRSPRARAARAGSAKLDNDNAQREYYLTDVDRARGRATACGSQGTVIAVARPRCSASTTARSSRRRAHVAAPASRNDLMSRGVTLADPARLDVRGELSVRARRVHRRRLRVRRRGDARRPRADRAVLRDRDMHARRRHASCIRTASSTDARSAPTARSARSRACAPARTSGTT